MVFLSVHDMIVGKYGLSDLAGPVGTVSVVSTAVKTSAYSMLRIMALLTINVGLFNLFPIPALDGWRLFLLIFEGIFKRKLPDKWDWAINAVGLVLLLGLMCVITFSDITKLL
jgi:regulator of sigma E protease